MHSIGGVLRTEIIQKFKLKIIQKFIIKECTGGALLGESPLARNLTKSVQNQTESRLAGRQAERGVLRTEIIQKFRIKIIQKFSFASE